MLKLETRATRCLIAICILLIAATTLRAEDDLRILDSQHYRIHTDLDRDFAEDLAHRMDGMYEEYMRRLAPVADLAADTQPTGPKLEAYLFAKKESYLKLTGERFPNTGGVFVPGRNMLAAFLEGQGRDGLRLTLQHEACHQFVYSVLSEDFPVWLNEGLAQIFEEGIWTGNDFLLGQVPPRRLRQLQADIESNKLVDFRTLLSMPNKQWTQNLADRSRAMTQYNQAWAMAHFLVYATDSNGNLRFRKRLLSMLGSIHKGAPAKDAFIDAFSDNIDGFRQRFIEYAATLKPTREATIIERQQVLADMLIGLKSQGMKFDDIEGFRKRVEGSNVRLQYTRGQLQWQTDEESGIYFCDLEHRLLTPHRLYFDKPKDPLPDIICKPHEGLQYRTRFFQAGAKTEYEIIAASP